MLECWNEDFEDRPTFAELREKFGTLILAGKEGLYIDLQVDEMKPYYVIKDEEEEKRPRLRAVSDTEAMEKIKSEKGKDAVERVASRNPYVEGPGRRPQESEPISLEDDDEQPLARSAPRTDERLGISIAMLASEQSSQHEALERRTTNPYVDNPGRVAIAEETEVMVHAESPLDEQTEVGGEAAGNGDIENYDPTAETTEM